MTKLKKKKMRIQQSKYIVKIAAKINLYLHIKNKCENKKHTLETLCQSIDIYDTVTFISSDNTVFAVMCDDPNFDKSLFVKQCMKQFDDFNEYQGADLSGYFYIEKKIPFGYGLGSSSTFLAALSRIYIENFLDSAKLSDDKYMDEYNKKLAQLSSDAVLMQHTGTFLLTGYGEKVKRVPGQESQYGLIFPKHREVTGNIYQQYDEHIHKRIFDNDFLEILIEQNSEIKEIMAIADANNVKVYMTGSGSCMFIKDNVENNIKLFDMFETKIVQAVESEE